MELQEGNSPGARFGHIVDDIKAMLSEFSRWQVAHVRRGANGAAHGLAKLAIRNVLDRVWTVSTPTGMVLRNGFLSMRSQVFAKKKKKIWNGHGMAWQTRRRHYSA